MYFRVNFEVHSGYGGPFLSIPVRSGAFRSIPVSKRTLFVMGFRDDVAWQHWLDIIFLYIPIPCIRRTALSTFHMVSMWISPYYSSCSHQKIEFTIVQGLRTLPGFMHQSFATTSPQGPGNSGDIDFFICKAQVQSPIDPKAYLGCCKTIAFLSWKQRFCHPFSKVIMYTISLPWKNLLTTNGLSILLLGVIWGCHIYQIG